MDPHQPVQVFEDEEMAENLANTTLAGSELKNTRQFNQNEINLDNAE